MKKFLVLILWFSISLHIVEAATINAATFSIAVLPDTQKYSRYNIGMFSEQTQWIADNSTSHHIAFTVHLGDLVDRASQEYEWKNADSALTILGTAQLPYSVLAGNNDLLKAYKNDAERDANEPFLRYFPVDRFSTQPGYGGHSPSSFNSYFIFQAQRQEFLVLALDWRLSEESIVWVQSILDAHPDTPTILTTHQLVNMERRTGEAHISNNGERLWNELIAPNNQIFLAINGHDYGVAHTVRQNHAGNDVLLMLVNYQHNYNGGNGMMRLLSFDLQAGTIQAETFSPYVLAIPPEKRSDKDKERKTDPANQFTIELDISSRFEPN